MATDVVKDGKWTGVKTAAGELLIDAADGFWTLKDPQGRTLIPEGRLARRRERADGKAVCDIARGVRFAKVI